MLTHFRIIVLLEIKSSSKDPIGLDMISRGTDTDGTFIGDTGVIDKHAVVRLSLSRSVRSLHFFGMRRRKTAPFPIVLCHGVSLKRFKQRTSSLISISWPAKDEMELVSLLRGFMRCPFTSKLKHESHQQPRRNIRYLICLSWGHMRGRRVSY